MSGNHSPVFNELCSRLSEKYYPREKMAFDHICHQEFIDSCADCFRIAAQLLSEGILTETEYKYIINMAFIAEVNTQYHIFYYALEYNELTTERKEENENEINSEHNSNRISNRKERSNKGLWGILQGRNHAR